MQQQRFSCSAVVTVGERTITIEHNHDHPDRPATTTAQINDNGGLRDGMLVSAELVGETAKFYLIDGESPDSPHVAVQLNEDRHSAFVGEWVAPGKTATDFAAAAKEVKNMVAASIARLSITRLSNY